MNLLPKSHEEFSQKEYWDSFFKKRGNKAFEWYGEYPELSEHLHKYIKKQDNILITGCGNSTLGKDLYDIGYEKIINIDISNVVIRQMLSQNEKNRPNLQYLQMDALNTTFDDEQFSVVLDKGTLDALMPDNIEETVTKIEKYFSEIGRILKIGGRYICISLLQEHILKIILEHFPSNNWMFRAVRCFDAEQKAIENGENAMPVFIIVCTKFKALPRKILEINLSSADKMQRLENIKDVILNISNVQQAAFICSGLKKASIAEENEVSIDLYEPGSVRPRFTVYVVDIPPESKHAQFAAFIVPQGREAEWLFSTKAGRKHLVKLTKHNRLVIITLHRGQKYESFEVVQNELTDTVCNLAPCTLTNKKIAFLSLGSDVGKRVIKCEGHSDCSGDYVVEDIETDNGEKYRRLYYLSNQLVIQSEARIKTIKSKKGQTKDIIDLTYLTCKHHVYMSLSAHWACENKLNSTIFVIGLGGGGLCSFLHKFLPKCKIHGVDIDKDMLKIASEWFAFQQNENLSAHIQDGIEFLKNAASKDEKVNAVLFDVDSKDTSIGMSCPPQQFLEDTVLDAIVKILNDSGLFILNIVLRDQSLRPTILLNLKKKFKTIICYKLEEDLNEIMICSVNKINENKLKENLKESCNEINRFFKKNQPNTDIVYIPDFITDLKINS